MIAVTGRCVMENPNSQHSGTHWQQKANWFVLTAFLVFGCAFLLSPLAVRAAAVPDPGQVSDLYKVGYYEFRIVDSERPRIVGGQGRLGRVPFGLIRSYL